MHGVQVDVKKDGDIIFSKHDAGRFPANDEILKMLRKQQK
ncbi:Rdx family protein [Deltaproteobacteria bacterium]|nr:Rdx family protein [Deltaproteobacteria bacterium]